MQYKVYRGKKFSKWWEGLKDRKAAALIAKRFERIERTGNLGDWKQLSGQDGLCELIFTYGPGYRVYFGFCGKTLVVVVGGGDKTTGGGQDADIEVAHRRWLVAKEHGYERI